LGNFLGIHDIIFLLASYLTQRYFHRFRALFRIQQSIIVAGMIFTYQIYFILISNYFSTSIFAELIALTFISSFFWPIIYGLLRYLRIKLTYGK
jgi:rod shape-determining protein MreD